MFKNGYFNNSGSGGSGGGGGSGGTVSWDDIQNKPQSYPPNDHDHDERYYTREEIDDMDFGGSEGGGFDGTVEWSNVSNKPQTYPPSEHNHDDRYNTKEDVQGIINFATEQMAQKQGKVKASEDDEADYLSSKVDNVTLTVHGGELKVKSVDGLTVGVTDISSWLQGTEGNIQGQINDLAMLLNTMSSGMSFKGTAEDYAELSDYSNVENGEVVVVLKDETKDDGRSMYIYSGDLGMWRYIGTFTFSTKFTALEDTPSGYEDGKYLKSTNNGIVYDDVDYQELVNKPQSSITAIDDAVAKRHEHGNKNVIDSVSESDNGILTYKGEEYVRKSDLSIHVGEKEFLQAVRSGSTQVLNGASVLIFNNILHARGGLSYDTTTGLITLTPWRVYRVSVTPVLNFANRSGTNNIRLWNHRTNTQYGHSGLIYPAGGSLTYSPTNFLDLIVAPSAEDAVFSVRSASADKMNLVANYSSMIIQEI